MHFINVQRNAKNEKHSQPRAIRIENAFFGGVFNKWIVSSLIGFNIFRCNQPVRRPSNFYNEVLSWEKIIIILTQKNFSCSYHIRFRLY